MRLIWLFSAPIDEKSLTACIKSTFPVYGANAIGIGEFQKTEVEAVIMKTRLALLSSLAILFACVPAIAQEPVIGVTGAEADALFTSSDKQLNVNKQAAYHIMKDLLEANHWELADKWLTPEYHQHNPNVASGRDGVVKFFMSFRKPSEIPEHLTKTRIVAVVAEGDLVIVVTPRELADPRDPSKKYTTAWFDMWRFKDGRADEHWDGATIIPPPPPSPKAN
jgi:predicted SnoaL-like aldol condensation-catalyzing enzyme